MAERKTKKQSSRKKNSSQNKRTNSSKSDKSSKSNSSKKMGRSKTNSQSKEQQPKKLTKKEQEQLNIENEIRRTERLKKRNQSLALMVLGIALILFSIVLIPTSAGTVWFSIRGIIFGLFGYSAFLLPCIMAYISIMMAMDKMQTHVGTKILQGLTLIIFISALMYIISYPANQTLNFAADVSKEFNKYFNDGTIGMGIFGALVGEALMLLGSSKTPAIAIIAICIFLSYMVFTGFTLIRLIKGIQKPAEKVKAKIDNKTLQKQNNDDKHTNKKKDGKEGTGSKHVKRYPVFTEADLLGPAEQDMSESVATDVSSTKTKGKSNKTSSEPTDVIADIKDCADNVEDIFAIAAKIQEEQEEQKLSNAEIVEAGKDFAAEVANTSDKEETNYILPPVSCLRMPVKNAGVASQADLKATADKLIDALNSFNVDAKIINVVPGPSVTRYEVAPAPGVKISKFTGLADDIALHLAAPAGVRIEAPIPNKSAIGIEVPNRGRITVTMREIIESDTYKQSKSKINVALGKDIAGNVVCADLAKMPHLLVAGTTGSGKSVCLNAMIVSILYNAKPGEVKLLLIDPKQVEFSIYNSIPHLLVPVVSDARKAAGALGWAVTEMLNRYKTLNDTGVRDIVAYNKMCEEDETMEKMSQIVIFIDELSDLMSVAPSEVESSITRLAQMARAAGMHLVVATQRPSVDVITGLIKANIPSRIALAVSSQVDSRTILDSSGAEKLLGLGDMLFSPVGKSKPLRVQGCYVSDAEITQVVEFVKNQESSSYDDNIQQEIDKQALATAPKKNTKDSDAFIQGVSDADSEIVMKAAELVIDNPEKASISALQRNLSLGFAKAGRIMDTLEEKGVVGPHAGSKPRKVLMTKAQWYEMNSMASSLGETADVNSDIDTVVNQSDITDDT